MHIHCNTACESKSLADACGRLAEGELKQKEKDNPAVFLRIFSVSTWSTFQRGESQMLDLTVVHTLMKKCGQNDGVEAGQGMICGLLTRAAKGRGEG